MTAQQYAWRVAGEPVADLEPETMPGVCATCGGNDTMGVPTDAINSGTFSMQSDFFRFGTHCCRACTWLYRMGKSQPGNIMAAGGKLYRPTIAENEGRDRWIRVLEEVSKLPPDAPVMGIITTDVKPRVWPRVRMATRSNFGLVVHAPEYDVTGFLAFSLDKLLEITRFAAPILARGYSKRSLLLGILRDYPRASKHIQEAIAWEKQLEQYRIEAAFAPALVAAAAGEESIDGFTGAVEQTPATSRKTTKGQPGLFQ